MKDFIVYYRSACRSFGWVNGVAYQCKCRGGSVSPLREGSSFSGVLKNVCRPVALSCFSSITCINGCGSCLCYCPSSIIHGLSFQFEASIMKNFQVDGVGRGWSQFLVDAYMRFFSWVNFAELFEGIFSFAPCHIKKGGMWACDASGRTIQDLLLCELLASLFYSAFS